jgi:MarR family transcriptional regulator, organic hydroperoxide resistance regulator
MQSSEQLTAVIREWAEVFMHRSGRDFKRFMDTTGLSFSQINILMRLVHGGSAGVSEIGEKMGVTNAAASQSIDKLVQMGLIERTEDPTDRRAKRLELAPKGHALIEKGIEARTKWVEGITDALLPEQQDSIISALTLLTAAARKTED